MSASRIVPEGALVAFDGGAGFESYVVGVYRALEDLDLDEVAREYGAVSAADPPDPRLPRDHASLVGQTSTADPLELGFIDWLVAEGRLSREPVAMATVEASRSPGRPARVSVECELPDPGPAAGPGGP